MVVVEAARRGKQLGEVHGFAAAAVEVDRKSLTLGPRRAGPTALSAMRTRALT